MPNYDQYLPRAKKAVNAIIAAVQPNPFANKQMAADWIAQAMAGGADSDSVAIGLSGKPGVILRGDNVQRAADAMRPYFGKSKDAALIPVDSGLHYVPVEGGWMPEELVREKTEKWYAITVWLPGSSGGNWRTDRNNITSKDEAIAIAARDFEGKKRRVVEMPNREVVAEWTYRSQGGRTVAERIKALVAVDLHGTIADKRADHSGEYDPSAYDLQPGAVEALKELRDEGHEVAIWTCWATDEARRWLDENGVPYDYVNEEAPDHGSPKIDADLYVDDKAVPHNGDWGRTMEAVRASGRLEKGLRVRVKAVREVSCENCSGVGCHLCGHTGKLLVADDKNVAKARDPKNLQEFAAEVNRIARGAPASAKFGSKVYIGYIEYEYSIPGFRQMLLEAHRAGLVTLARFDMSYVADQRDVRASEMYGDAIGTFHFVVPKSASTWKFLGRTATGGARYKRMAETCPDCGEEVAG